MASIGDPELSTELGYVWAGVSCAGLALPRFGVWASRSGSCSKSCSRIMITYSVYLRKYLPRHGKTEFPNLECPMERGSQPMEPEKRQELVEDLSWNPRKMPRSNTVRRGLVGLP